MSDHGGLTARDFPGLAAELLDRAIFGEQLNQEPKQRKSKMADEQNQKRSIFKKIGVLWKEKDKNDRGYYTGVFDVPFPSIIAPGTRIMVFPVKEKPKDKDGKEIEKYPDAELFVTIERENEGPQPSPGQAAEKKDLPF